MTTMKDKCVGMINEFREGDNMTKNDGFELDGTFAIVMRGSIKDANIINELIEEMNNLHVYFTPPKIELFQIFETVM